MSTWVVKTVTVSTSGLMVARTSNPGSRGGRPDSRMGRQVVLDLDLALPVKVTGLVQGRYGSTKNLKNTSEKIIDELT